MFDDSKMKKKKVIGNLPFFDDIDPEDNLQMERNTLIAFSEKGDVVEVIFFFVSEDEIINIKFVNECESGDEDQNICKSNAFKYAFLASNEKVKNQSFKILKTYIYKSIYR